MRRLAYLLPMMLALSQPLGAQSGAPFQSLSFAEVRQLAGTLDRPFILYFSADWCLPCQWMDTHTWPDELLTSYLNAHYLALRLNIDEGDEPTLRLRFSVDKYPTILLFNAAGVLADRQENSLSAADMLSWLQANDILANHLHPVVEAPVGEELALEAPRPTVSFSRPALLPEAEGELAQVPDIVVPKPALEEVLTAAEPTFTPRTGQRYGVAIGPQTYTYTEGVRTAAELERKLGQRWNLQPLDDGRFKIVSGDFGEVGEARRWLIFLNRNDLIGEVVPLRP
ncbi:MAG: thioredoxin family protein [Lewinella sp.]|nr:thioredoxin family protein [Lewinella sp.]